MIDNEKIMESINGVKDDIFKILNNLQQQLDDIKQQQNKEEPVVDDRSNEDVFKILNNLQQQLDDIKQQQNKEEPVVDDRSNEDVISSEEAWESLFE